MAVRSRSAFKPMGLMEEAGKLFSVGLEAVHTSFRRPWPLQEFLEQMWFLIKVTSIPVILISIPFGMVISLQVGSFATQLGAQAHIGAAMVLAVVREEAPVARRCAPTSGRAASATRSTPWRSWASTRSSG